MYEQVRRTARPRMRGNGKLILALAVCAAILAVMVGMMFYLGRYTFRFRQFLTDLTDSAAYTYQHGVVLLETEEGTVPVEDTSRLTMAIQRAGMGREVPVPEGEPDAVLTYADGSTLALWDAMLEGYQPSWTPGRELPEAGQTETVPGVVLCYTESQGAAYCYDTNQVGLDALLAGLGG